MLTFVFIIIILALYIVIKTYYPRVQAAINSTFLPILVTIMVFYIILFPKEIIEAAKNGLTIWFDAVLPALLPFFIGAELLIGLGVVKFIGTLIEPIMRPLFKAPGEASFIFAMSITSGYPMGVKLTSDLRRKGIISSIEAQRMVALCSTSGPLFIIGAVAIGMFNNQNIGPYIIIPHYLGALTVGILFRFYKSSDFAYIKPNRNTNIIKKAFNDMLKARREDGRPFGKLLGDSVKESISTLLLIGGLIVVFSVIIKEIQLSGIIDLIYINISHFSNNKSLVMSIIKIFMTGFIELTIGCKVIAESQALTPMLQIILATIVISWSGLSVHAQAASMMNDTDIKMNIYIISKFLHGIFSGIYAFIIYNLAESLNTNASIHVFSNNMIVIKHYTWFNRFFFSLEIFIGITLTLLIIGMCGKNIRN